MTGGTSTPEQSSTGPGATAQSPYATGTSYYYPRPGHYSYWPYQATGHPFTTGSQSYPYGYYATAGPMNQGSYMYSADQYRSNQLNWQQPYKGPRYDASVSGNSTAASQPGAQPDLASSTGESMTVGQSTMTTESTAQQAQDVPASSISGQDTTEGTLNKLISFPGDEQNIMKELVALSSMPPSQIADALRDNPQLRDIVLAAIDQTKKSSLTPE